MDGSDATRIFVNGEATHLFAILGWFLALGAVAAVSLYVWLRRNF